MKSRMIRLLREEKTSRRSEKAKKDRNASWKVSNDARDDESDGIVTYEKMRP